MASGSTRNVPSLRNRPTSFAILSASAQVFLTPPTPFLPRNDGSEGHGRRNTGPILDSRSFVHERTLTERRKCQASRYLTFPFADFNCGIAPALKYLPVTKASYSKTCETTYIMDHAEVNNLVKQLAAGFETLQEEYQKLYEQHQALERKLATAREQVCAEKFYYINPLYTYSLMKHQLALDL